MYSLSELETFLYRNTSPEHILHKETDSYQGSKSEGQYFTLAENSLQEGGDILSSTATTVTAPPSSPVNLGPWILFTIVLTALYKTMTK